MKMKKHHKEYRLVFKTAFFGLTAATPMIARLLGDENACPNTISSTSIGAAKSALMGISLLKS